MLRNAGSGKKAKSSGVEKRPGKEYNLRWFTQPGQQVLLIDSTTIRLFRDILKGVGRNPKGDGKKKGGLKVHMLIDAVQSVGRFIKITEAKALDKNLLKSLEINIPQHDCFRQGI
jgi:hypothetical protein